MSPEVCPVLFIMPVVFLLTSLSVLRPEKQKYILLSGPTEKKDAKRYIGKDL